MNRLKLKLQTLRGAMYIRLVRKLNEQIPDDLPCHIMVYPTLDKKEDEVIISIMVPHKLTRKAMLHYKVWRKS